MGKTFLISLALSAGLAQAQSWELRVCADPDNLPYSNRALQGFDNRIIALIAKDLGARLAYVWWVQGDSMVNDQLRQGGCDLMLSAGEGYKGVLSSLAYYQSSYVFVYRENSPYRISSMDDAALKGLRIAVETAGIPPYESLANRGLAEKAVILEAVDPKKTSSSPIIEAVAAGRADVAVLWGPVAAHYARKQPVRLRVVPVTPEFEPPALSMVYPITMGVRAGDEALRDRLSVAIARRWDSIQAILREFTVPQIPLPKPVVEVRR